MKLNFTCLSVLLVAIVSYGLYQLSYEVQKLERDLQILHASISGNEESIRILKAEWAYQNRPDVLQTLANKHLPLLLIAPYQVAAVNEIPEIAVSALTDPKDVPRPRLNPKRDYSKPVELPKGAVRLATFSRSGELQ